MALPVEAIQNRRRYEASRNPQAATSQEIAPLHATNLRLP